MFIRKDHRPEPSPEMFYGVWWVGSSPNQYEPCHCTCCNNQHNAIPHPPEVCGFYMIPMPKDKFRDIPCWDCHDRRRWKHGMGCHGRNPWRFLRIFNKMRRRQDHCASCPAPHRHDGWRTWRRPMSPAALWFCWRVLRRLFEMLEFSHWLRWRMRLERLPECGECLEMSKYLDWLRWSSSHMITSNTILSLEIPQCLAALVVCRMLNSTLRTCNWCFYYFSA